MMGDMIYLTCRTGTVLAELEIMTIKGRSADEGLDADNAVSAAFAGTQPLSLMRCDARLRKQTSNVLNNNSLSSFS